MKNPIIKVLVLILPFLMMGFSDFALALTNYTNTSDSHFAARRLSATDTWSCVVLPDSTPNLVFKNTINYPITCGAAIGTPLGQYETGTGYPRYVKSGVPAMTASSCGANSVVTGGSTSCACNSGYSAVLENGTYACKSNSNLCTVGTYNTTTGVCEVPSCPSGQYMYSGSCQTEEAINASDSGCATLRTGMVFNTSTGSCTAAPTSEQCAARSPTRFSVKVCNGPSDGSGTCGQSDRYAFLHNNESINGCEYAPVASSAKDCFNLPETPTVYYCEQEYAPTGNTGFIPLGQPFDLLMVGDETAPAGVTCPSGSTYIQQASGGHACTYPDGSITSPVTTDTTGGAAGQGTIGSGTPGTNGLPSSSSTSPNNQYSGSGTQNDGEANQATSPDLAALEDAIKGKYNPNDEDRGRNYSQLQNQNVISAIEQMPTMQQNLCGNNPNDCFFSWSRWIPVGQATYVSDPTITKLGKTYTFPLNKILTTLKMIAAWLVTLITFAIILSMLKERVR